MFLIVSHHIAKFPYRYCHIANSSSILIGDFYLFIFNVFPNLPFLLTKGKDLFGRLRSTFTVYNLSRDKEARRGHSYFFSSDFFQTLLYYRWNQVLFFSMPTVMAFRSGIAFHSLILKFNNIVSYNCTH